MSDWYYAVDNEQKGPINESELKEHLAANKVPADALVWKDGMDAWTPANQVPAFSFRQPPIPAKVQPPAPAAAVPAAFAAKSAVSNPDSTKPADLSSVMGVPEALEVDADDAEKNKIFGILAYLPFLFLVPLFAAKDSPYAKYHANQGLVLFIVMLAAFTVAEFFTFIPFVDFIFKFVYILLYPVFLVLTIYGIVQAAAGKCVPLPVIGGFKLIK